ncbi:MAG: isoprenylcysteine carboxylmethyltransferase family protein [Pyrinomonadaceae bacterium]|nr:isoprenylcysteine carboxylmethyltransferase family protein [Pyrinomonadaceae bacterium]
MVSKNKRFLQRLRVPLGFIIAVIFLLFANSKPLTLLIGGIVSVIGLFIRAWASGHIRKGQTLAVAGPYSYTRNPLYLGSFLIGVGFCAVSNVWWLALSFCAFFIAVYLPVMRVEAEDLKSAFGGGYKEYAQNVPMFFPRFSAWKKTNEKFDFHLYLRYREYRAALGLLFAIMVLAARTFL